MPGRYYDVDEEGNIIDPRIVDRPPGEVVSRDEYRNDPYSDHHERNYSPYPPFRSRSRSRHRSYSNERQSNRKPWKVPVNPLLRTYNSADEDSDPSHHRHHRHRHHRHHRHHHRSRSNSKQRFRQYNKKNTPADTKDRWGHELYIENVVLNPEPEPPRMRHNYEPPKEKWISKAGGVAIFTSRPTSASSYQGRHDM